MITVFGSANLDLIGTVSRIPKPARRCPATCSPLPPAARAPTRRSPRAALVPPFVMSAQSAPMRLPAKHRASREGRCRSAALARRDGPTGVAMIFVDPHGENVIAILPGANGTVSAADADAALGALPSGAVLVLQQEVPQAATRRALEIAKARGLRSILNTAPFLTTTPEVAPLATILVANETEFALLCDGKTTPLDGLMRDWAKSTSRPSS